MEQGCREGLGCRGKGRSRGRDQGAMQRPGASASTAQARRTKTSHLYGDNGSKHRDRKLRLDGRRVLLQPIKAGPAGKREGKCGQEPISENRPPPST